MQVFKVLTASPVAQQMKREAGKEAATDYLIEVLNKARKAVERVKVDGVAEVVFRHIDPERLERASLDNRSPCKIPTLYIPTLYIGQTTQQKR